MPSSSLFLRSSATLVSILSLFSASASAADSNTKYTNVKTYSGNGFYDGFNFFTDADPTHGFVTYVDKNTAMNSGLTRLENGVFRMGVDSDNVYDPNSAYYGNNGFGRPSVRLESKDAFTKGLFIIDVLNMPGNVCGVWPAFWTTVNADTWPVGGEIDIVESISNRDISMAVLHTSGQSVINSDKSTMSGTVQTTDCRYDVATGSNAAGCAIANTDPGNYGVGLNNNGGRIFAMEWTDDTVKVWSFPRSSYPSDIDSGNPDPSKWGLPVQNFAGDSANIKDNFYNHKIVINTDFCGDFGDAVWSGEGCATSTGYDTCEAFVANNPAAFVDQFWKINSLKVFQRTAAPSSSSTTSSSTTSSTTKSTTSSTTKRSTTSSSSTTSSGFTTVTLSTTSSTTTSASSTNPFSSTSSTSSFSTTSPTSSYPFDTTSRHFTYTNSSSTSPFTTSTSTSSYFDGTSTTTTDTYTYTTSSPSSSWTWTWTSTETTSTSSTSSKSITAPIISATGFPGYAQGGSNQPQNWAVWASPDPTPEFIKTTITTTYVVPCSTGLSTSTVSVVTSFAGGKKVTYTPKLSVTTYTTSCPVEWGFGGAVTVTVPVTTTKTIVSVKTGGSKGGSGSSNGSGSGSSSGSGSGSGSSSGSGNNSGNGSGSNNSVSNSNGSGSASGNGSGSVSNGNGSGSNSGSNSDSGNNGWPNTASTTTLATTFTGPPAIATPDATSKGPSDPASTAGGYAAASTAYYYGTGSGSDSDSSSGSGSGSGSSGADWSSWNNSNVTSPIATYKGAASRMGVSAAMIVVVAAVLGLMM